MLREVQRSIAGWIRAPEGVAAALAEAERGAEGDRSAAGPRRLAALVCSDATLSATERLEIYANAYFVRLLGVLRDDYPALAARLGEAGFHDLVTSYLLVEPSRHPSLRHAGERLPGFLRDHAAASGLRERAPWAADLAALEWARVDVFDAADTPVLARAAVAALEPDSFAGLELRLGPWVRLGRHGHPVDRLWREAAGGDAPDDEVSRPDPDDPPEDEVSRPDADGEMPTALVRVLVWRQREAVVHRRVDADEAFALDRLARGARFDELCASVAARLGEAEAPPRVAAWLERWLADGILEGGPSGSVPDAAGASAAD